MRFGPWKGLLWRWWLILMLATGAGSSSAAVLRVKPGATGSPADGSSWDNAFQSITNALSASVIGDEIWVGAGVYSGGILMKSGVALYGGFAGTESTRDERNPEINESIIDGRGSLSGFFFTNSAQSDTRVDGFTVRFCTGTFGAAFRVQIGSPTIANNRIINSVATLFGAGVYLESSAAVVVSNLFSYNGSDTMAGGGALFASNSTPRIEGNTFSANRARDGGAVGFSQSSGFLERNHFIANRAQRDGGAVTYYNSSPRTTLNRFSGNLSGARGGALFVTGGGSSPVLFNNVLIRNAAALAGGDSLGGGALYIDTFSLPSVINNTLISNTAPVGGILSSNAAVTLANNVIAFGSSGIGGAPSFQLFHNNLFGNGGSNYVGLADATGTAGNISADPQFGGDTSLGVVNLLPTSPCRDAGSDPHLPAGALVDINDQPRIQGAAVDIGATESDGVATYFPSPVVRVSPTGNDTARGDSWATAMRSIQAALNRAWWKGGEVWVQQGSYPANLLVRPFTSLYGGFAGTETNRNQRDWRENVTILDAKEETGGVTMVQLNLGETLDGFTVQNGFSTAGAGVFTDSSVRISHNRFASNVIYPTTPPAAVRGGGAIYVGGGSPQILNNEFFRNLAFAAGRTQPAEGGAIKVNDGTPLIANNLFRHNIVTNSGAQAEARGSAVATLFRGAARIINNTFLQNTATVSTGAAVPDQGVIYLGNTNLGAVLGNNLIAYNSSGIYVPGQAPTLRHNLVYANIRTNYERISDPTGTQGNISISPRLTGPYGDWHLAPGSPAINAGDNSLVQPDWTDLDGHPRTINGVVDIGVDEFDGTIYPVPERIFYVKMNGNDARDGRSWANARKSLSLTLLEASLEGGEVWVQAGRYTNRFRSEVFTYLYGGFEGTETNRLERNWALNPTVLDGDISAGGTPVVGEAVVSVYGMDGYGALSGFIVQNGRGRQGGGVFAHGSPQISGNIIRSNLVSNVAGFTAVGAGIYSQGGAPTMLNNLLYANSAPISSGAHGRGGGVYLNPPAGAQPVLVNNTILTNFAVNGGGAIYLTEGSSARLINNVIAFNSSGVAAASPAPANRVVFNRNCLFGNGLNELINVTAGPGNFTADPRLVDWRQGNFLLRADSPCLDSADGSVPLVGVDIFGQSRVAHNGLDIGAVEFNGPLEADYDIVLTQPVQGAASFAPATIPVAATVSGGTGGLAYVEFSANEQVVAVSTNAPFVSSATDLQYGDYEVVAKVITSAGSVQTSAPVNISILLPPGNVPPTVTITSPTNSQVIPATGPATVRTTFNFSKPGGRILSWALFDGTIKLAENLNVLANQNSATVTVPNLALGRYTFTAIVISTVGDRATNEVTFSVGERPPVEPPVLLLPELQTDGTALLQMSLPTPGAVYRLETSTNLIEWWLMATGAGGSPNLVTNVPVTNAFQHYRGLGAFPD